LKTGNGTKAIKFQHPDQKKWILAQWNSIRTLL